MIKVSLEHCNNMLNTCMNHIPELLCAGIALSLSTEHNNPCKIGSVQVD